VLKPILEVLLAPFLSERCDLALRVSVNYPLHCSDNLWDSIAPRWTGTEWQRCRRKWV